MPKDSSSASSVVSEVSAVEESEVAAREAVLRGHGELKSPVVSLDAVKPE
jgi:hypothetical protein